MGEFRTARQKGKTARRGLTLGSVPRKNLRAHQIRALTLLLLVIGQAACVFGGLAMNRSMRMEMTRAEARLGADILVYPSGVMSKISSKTLIMQGSPIAYWKDRSLLSRMADCEGIDAVSYQIYLQDTSGEKPVWIAGLDPERDFAISAWLETGNRLDLPDGTAAAGSRVKTEMDGTVRLFGKSWPVTGRLVKTGSELDEMVFVSFRTLGDLIAASEEMGITAYRNVDTENDFTVALVRVSDRDRLDSVTSWLNTYVRKIRAVRGEATLTDTAAGIQGQFGLITVIMVCAWLALLAAQAVAQSMMMKERRKELFVWHVVGASRRIVNRVMLREAAYIYLTGGLIGSAIAAPLVILVGGASLPPASAGLFAGLAICLSGLIGCVSTLISVKKATESMSGQMLLTV